MSPRRNPFSFLFPPSRREHFLAEYLIREHERGRSLEDVLADAYVVNRSTPEQRARVLERPEIVEAIGDHTLDAMRRSLAGEGTPAPR
jgi:hypothetical protein